MPKHILVTGGTGFLGSHIIDQILEAPQGYKVRALARQAKLEGFRNAYSDYAAQERFEAVELKDLAHERFDPSLFEGIDAVMHVASPLAGRETPEVMLEMAVEGTLNIVRQAQAAGIRKFVVTSSIAAVGNVADRASNPTLKADSWNSVTREMALQSDDAMVVYAASKTLAEKALWEFADAHRHTDVTTVNPTFLYGPFSKGQEIPKETNLNALATNAYFYNLLSSAGGFPSVAYHVDVRDAARVHVLALESPPKTPGETTQRRFPVSSPNPFRWKEVVALIKNKRPALAERVTKADLSVADSGHDRAIVEWDRLESILGFKKSEFKSFEDTVLSAVDAVVDAEKRWNQKI